MNRRIFLSTLAAAATSARAANEDDLDFSQLIQPVPLDAKFIDERYYIWCGAPIQSEDGRYHLFYSRWPRELGHNAWVTRSEIAHAVSDRPLGPYRHRDVALPARSPEFWDGACTHNPNIIRVGKQYCLFYMGNTGDGKLMKELNYSHRNHQRIGVAIADRPEGPWQRFDHPALDANPEKGSFDSLMVSNPGAAPRPEGGVLLVYKGVIDDGSPHGGRVRYGVATSKTAAGPYVRHPGTIFEANDGGKEWMLAEDPTSGAARIATGPSRAMSSAASVAPTEAWPSSNRATALIGSPPAIPKCSTITSPGLTARAVELRSNVPRYSSKKEFPSPCSAP